MKTESRFPNSIYFLAVFHLPFLWEALWYDESALIENSKHVGITDFTLGLNWLQTIPAGYFLMSKSLLELPGGLFLLRLLSLIFLIWGVRLIDKYLLSKLSKPELRNPILMILILNTFSLKYGTDAKPYTLEFLLSAAFIVISLKRHIFKMSLLAIFAPFLATSSFIAGFGCLATTGIRTRSPKYLIPLVGLGSATLLNSCLVPNNTKKAMQIAWFGDLAKFDSSSIKSAVGGIFWIPTSGLGIIPNGLKLEVSYLLSGLVFSLLLLFVLIHSWRLELTQSLVITLALALLLHALLLVPVAGRLMQGLSLLLLLAFALSIDASNLSKSKIKFLHVILVAITVLSVAQKYESFEIYQPISPHLYSGETYANIWAGPEVQDELRSKNKDLNPNLIIDIKKGNIISCARTHFYPGDNLVVKHLDLQLRRELAGIRELEVRLSTPTTQILKVLRPITSLSVDSRSSHSECTHKYRNFEIPSTL